MIIAIYGIPRSGKDTFINSVLSKNESAFHLKGSKTLNELSFDKYGCAFRQLDSSKQKEMRIEFTKLARELEKKYQLVIVDGHFSFPMGNSFKKVFTSNDLDLYDAFFYLKRTPDEIKRNFLSDSKKDYEEQLLSEETVNDWMGFEIKEMQNAIQSKEKDFIVLDSSPFSIDYVCSYRQSSKDIAISIVNDIRENAGSKPVILADLDKTISINDLTNDFIEKSQLDSSFPKVIFKGDYYTDYQFTVFHNFLFESQNYSEAIQYALDKMQLNTLLINDLKNLKKGCYVAAVTTGMVDAWLLKNKEIKLFDYIYGKRKDNALIITPFVKKLVSKYITLSNKTLAVGDSIIDLGMLQEANKGYLISMSKLDKRIIKAVENGEKLANIYQPPYSIFKYNFLKEAKVEW